MLFAHPSDQSDSENDTKTQRQRLTEEAKEEADRKAAEQHFIDLDQDGTSTINLLSNRSKCAYCLNTDHRSLGHCLECKQYFCNSVLPEVGSHLVLHLVRAKHRQVQLHRDSALGDLILDCIFCRKRNVFTLGIAPHWENKSNDIIICCRNFNCLTQDYIASHAINPTEWESIIKEKRFVDFLLTSSPVDEVTGVLTPTIKAIHDFESAAESGKPMSMTDILRRKHKHIKVPQVQLQWMNIDQYYSTFQFLIELEIEEDRKTYERLVFEEVEMTWEVFEKDRKKMSFELPMSEEINVNSLKRQEMLLIDPKTEELMAVCMIVDVLPNDRILAVVSKEEGGVRKGAAYNVKLLFRPTSFERMLEGLYKLKTQAPAVIDARIFQILLGNVYALKNTEIKTPRIKKAAFETIPNTPPLNPSQIAAAEKALTNCFSLLQGPPGTGKSVMCAAIVYYHTKVAVTLQKNKKRKILVCAPSNIAIDHITDYIRRTGVKALQVCSRTREKVDAPTGDSYLHTLIDREFEKSENATFKRLRQLSKEGHLERQDLAKLGKAEYEISLRIMKEHEVICTTCVASADPRLSTLQFPIVLVDEATQSIEPEGILPLLKKAEQVVLIGDHMQLGPVVMSTDAARAGLRQSLFERMIKLGISPIRLQTQYRMHPELSIFSSETFYEGGLQNGVSSLQRKDNTLDFPWPNPAKPLLFWHVIGKEELSASGTSYINKVEADIVKRVLETLYQAGLERGKACVITPYKGQRIYLKTLISHQLSAENDFYESIEINSIDSFQGREKDYVIISAVRSSDTSGIGFLNDERRLNVALTRSRNGMIIVGNSHSLAKGPFWRSLLHHCAVNKMIYEGSTVENLRPSLITFTKPENLVAFDKAKAIREMNLEELGNSKLKSYMMQDFRKSDMGFTHLPK